MYQVHFIRRQENNLHDKHAHIHHTQISTHDTFARDTREHTRSRAYSTYKHLTTRTYTAYKHRTARTYTTYKHHTVLLAHTAHTNTIRTYSTYKRRTTRTYTTYEHLAARVYTTHKHLAAHDEDTHFIPGTWCDTHMRILSDSTLFRLALLSAGLVRRPGRRRAVRRPRQVVLVRRRRHITIDGDCDGRYCECVYLFIYIYTKCVL